MINADTFSQRGRVALVTGSSTGIGLALARALAQAGATVVLNGRSATRLASARAQLNAEGLNAAHARVFDVGDAEAVEQAVADIESNIGAIDVLVNNAGLSRRGLFHQLAAADWQAVMHTNVDSAFLVGQAVARRMVVRKRGRIVNTCSIMSDVARPGTSAYAASKGALKMLTKAMAVDLGPLGITVNGIAPGYFRTELTAPLAADATMSSWIAGHTPVGRWGELDDLAPAIVFLASDAAAYVNGHLLVVDGGMTATL
jgi:gluconate 5-dehydrogenase